MKAQQRIPPCTLVLAAALVWVSPSTAESPQQMPAIKHTTIAAPVPKSNLSAANGDAERGKAVFIDRATGHCLLCHSVQSLNEPSQGNIGPPLDAVASRLSETQLRQRLVDSTKINPDSAMPAYYRNEGFTQVASEYAGKSVLTAQQVEDVLAYLLTLKGVANE